MLAGLLRPSEGEVRREVDALTYLGHTLAVKDDLTVRENLVFMQRFLAGPRAHVSGGDGLDRVIERMGLGRLPEQLGRTLSAGQRKRCALARLLLSPARLWLLDEPYANLDAQGVELFDTLLEEHVQAGGACIMSTHGTLRPEHLDYRECVLQAWEQAA
jgi:heme exporter protein A